MNTALASPAPFLLASLITSYPDSHFAEYTATVLVDADLSLPVEVRGKIEDALQNINKLDDLRSEYIDVFDRSKELNPLYETEYGRERAMFKANELSDIAGFYKAFGFDMGGDEVTKEMPDHLSVELEFYSLLTMKYAHLHEIGDLAGCEIVLDAQKKFLKDHLGRFVSSISERPGVKTSDFYSTILKWCADLVDEEAKRLEVNLEPATWFASQAEGDSVCCGSATIFTK